MQNRFIRGKVLKYYAITGMFILIFCNAFGMHIRRHILVVNMLVNQEKRFVQPEGICEISLGENYEYSIEYKEKKLMNQEDRTQIEALLGKGKSPSFMFVNSDVSVSGKMPEDVWQLFETLDTLCTRNDTDYFAVSFDSKLIDNGIYNSAIAFAVTNAVPSAISSKEFHPMLERLKSPPYDYGETNVNTNSIPFGADPARWF